ncbi:Protein ssh4 [Malassezia cuniculi]|uniref:Protein ssh4 n=1 Tax=Malassezia cuniculi TaxID=948313 RepID=A0AAF0J8N6_9BASI|nr:Protein ssh4 [Malassezia cuniculi]
MMFLAFIVFFVGVSLVSCLVALRSGGAIALGDDWPVDMVREEAREGRSSHRTAAQSWIDNADPGEAAGYARACAWLAQNPQEPARNTDITMLQFLNIQEKGVSAWCFEPPYEANPSVLVTGRTEITFLPDGPGMSPAEGGACSVQSNLPLPKINEVYYWETKMFSKPESTRVTVGVSTRPYPSFRAPGQTRFSLGYSSDGCACFNHPFNARSFGPEFLQGDVIGVGYRPRSGTIFFTRNGKRLGEAFTGLHGYNLFPTVAADGAAEVHVNFGQAGFVFIEANVIKWGLAPMVGTLAPPPAYGQDKGSILIARGSSSSRPRSPMPSAPPYFSAERPGGIRMDTFVAESNRDAGSSSAPSTPAASPPPYSPALPPTESRWGLASMLGLFRSDERAHDIEAGASRA